MWVYLTNRDCLSPVQQMVSRLQQCDEVDEIVIVDCGSTYPDLLDWYAMAPAKIVRCENLGSQGAWQVMQDTEDFYAVSDADLDITNVPNDFLTKLRNGLIDHPRYIKAGLSLAIDDLPLDSPFREEVIGHESQFWTERLDVDWYEAAIDTTFAVYRERAWQWYSPSLRAAPPYTARHLPWYLCESNLPKEWLWYFQRCAADTHWSSRFRNILPKTSEVAQAHQNKETNPATDNYSLAKMTIEPMIIPDESLRTFGNRQIEALGIHSPTALAKSIPFPFRPIISICVSVKNRSRMLHEGCLLENFPRTVRSISDLAEVLGPIELIVADFHSDDWPLSQWLVSAGNLRVKIITVDGDFSRGRGLNVAASHASCDRLFFTDADVIVGLEAIKRGLSSIERGVVRFPIFRYLDIENREQDFEDYSYGLTFLTSELAQRSGGVPEFFSWGGDDNIFYDRLAPLAVIERERDGDLLHQWHTESSKHHHHVRPRKSDYENYVKHTAESQFAVFSIEHPDWSGEIREIVLWKDGRFERPGIDCGTYLYEPGQHLTLKWDRWNAEILDWDKVSRCYRDSQRGVIAKLRIHPHGYWISQDGIDQQAFDQSVCSTLTQFFKSHGASVVDFGCGNGAYVRAFSAAGLRCDGYDGNPLTERLTDGACRALDLSLPVELETTYDWVLSLEVGEHIPSEFEDSFLGNIDRHNRKGVILSWAIPGQGGYGHINERSNDYIKKRFIDMGYSNDNVLEQQLRDSTSNCWWFRNTIMVFRRK